MSSPPSPASAAAAAAATTESSSAADPAPVSPSTVAPVAAAAHQPPPQRQFLSSPHRPPPPPPPPNPIFSGQPVIAKPLAPASHQALIYSTATAHHPHPHRGFPPRPAAAASSATIHRPPDHASASVSVSSAPGYIRASASPAVVMTFAAAQGRPFLYAGDRPVPVHHIRVPQAPPAAQQHQQHAPPTQPAFLVPRPAATLTVPSMPATSAAAGGGVGPPNGVPTPKVNAFPPVIPGTELKIIKERDRRRDDDIVAINDRKVRLLDDGSCSLYSLCRSWVWNGVPHETQPNFGDGQRLLPKPLPMSESQVSNDGERDDKSHNIVKEEPAGSVEELSSRDLLEEHIKRAKIVRARLRKERLLRIERYKQRLALLLPPPSELGRDAAT